jgi:hypothetical protein
VQLLVGKCFLLPWCTVNKILSWLRENLYHLNFNVVVRSQLKTVYLCVLLFIVYSCGYNAVFITLHYIYSLKLHLLKTFIKSYDIRLLHIYFYSGLAFHWLWWRYTVNKRSLFTSKQELCRQSRKKKLSWFHVRRHNGMTHSKIIYQSTRRNTP